MIVGIGLDMIETDRISAAAGERFMRRVFSADELEMLRARDMGVQQIAGCWAGKEAFIKAMGDGAKLTSYREIEVLRKPSGRPYINLQGKTQESAAALGISNIHISITNLEGLAAATVVLEKE